MQDQADKFKDFHASELLPLLQGFELRRQKICRRYLILLFTALSISIGACLYIYVQSNDFFYIMAVMMPTIIALVVTWSVLTSHFIEEFKTSVVGKVVNFFDPNLSYSPKASITQDQFLASALFRSHVERFQGEDFVSGTIGTTNIEFSEIHAEYSTTSTDSKGDRSETWHTIFKGVFFIADFHKDFRGKTLILPSASGGILGSVGQAMQGLSIEGSCDVVRLEDQDFNDEFAVYSEDQVEARYILSPGLMQRILDFKKKIGEELYISFVDSKLFLGIASANNKFEPKIFSSLLELSVAEEFLKDLELISGIVEDLNLNTRIWSKA